MKVFKNYGVSLLIWVILTGMILIRLTFYGNLNLSVGNADTSSYIESATTPVFSKNLLTGSRLFTTNLIYHLANAQECEQQAISYPALGKETYRVIQSCFDRIVFFQNIMAVIAWGLLALVVSKRLNGGYEKLLAITLITAFGFTPAIADWDSILGSESLTFSLFAISIALIIEICFNFISDGNNTKYSIFINSLAIGVLVLWTFTRDTNVYTLAVLFVMSIISIIVFPNVRKNKNLLILSIAVLVTTVIGVQSSILSRRWETPMTNVYLEIILPYPARVEFMQTLGMPDPRSAEYSIWFIENAPKAYTRFLLFHPGFTFTSLISNLDGIFYGNIQPYFYSEQTFIRKTLITVNEILHPSTHLVLILDILLLAGLTSSASRRKNKYFIIWVWLGIWLFFSALLTLAVSFFADSIGITRHTLFSVELFRLIMWIFLIILFDQTNRDNEDILASPK